MRSAWPSSRARERRERRRWKLVTRAILRNFACLSFLLVLTSCASTGGGFTPSPVKFYVSKPKQGGIVRAQAGERIPYADTDGWIVVSPDDMELLILEAGCR